MVAFYRAIEHNREHPEVLAKLIDRIESPPKSTSKQPTPTNSALRSQVNGTQSPAQNTRAKGTPTKPTPNPDGGVKPGRSVQFSADTVTKSTKNLSADSKLEQAVSEFLSAEEEDVEVTVEVGGAAN